MITNTSLSNSNNKQPCGSISSSSINKNMSKLLGRTLWPGFELRLFNLCVCHFCLCTQKLNKQSYDILLWLVWKFDQKRLIKGWKWIHLLMRLWATPYGICSAKFLSKREHKEADGITGRLKFFQSLSGNEWKSISQFNILRKSKKYSSKIMNIIDTFF
jgi:hypothetical protein